MMWFPGQDRFSPGDPCPPPQPPHSHAPPVVWVAGGGVVSKGAVRQEKRNVYYYSPLIGEKEYNTWATDDLIDRLYNGSARNLVAALVHSDGLTREDLEELQNMFIVED